MYFSVKPFKKKGNHCSPFFIQWTRLAQRRIGQITDKHNLVT